MSIKAFDAVERFRQFAHRRSDALGMQAQRADRSGASAMALRRRERATASVNRVPSHAHVRRTSAKHGLTPGRTLPGLIADAQKEDKH